MQRFTWRVDKDTKLQKFGLKDLKLSDIFFVLFTLSIFLFIVSEVLKIVLESRYWLIVISVFLFALATYYDYLAKKYATYIRVFSIAVANEQDREFLYYTAVEESDSLFSQTKRVPVYDEKKLSETTSRYLNQLHPKKYVYDKCVYISPYVKEKDESQEFEPDPIYVPEQWLHSDLKTLTLPSHEVFEWRRKLRLSRLLYRHSFYSVLASFTAAIIWSIILNYSNYFLISEKFNLAIVLVFSYGLFNGGYFFSRKQKKNNLKNWKEKRQQEIRDLRASALDQMTKNLTDEEKKRVDEISKNYLDGN